MSSVLHPGDGERRQTPTAKRSKPGGSLRHGWTHSTAREWNRESGTGVQASTGVAVPHPKISAPNLSWLSQPPFLHRVPKDAQRPACHFRISIPASCLCLQPASKHNIISRPNHHDLFRQSPTYLTMDVPEEPSNPFSTVTAQTNKLQRVRCDKGIPLSHTDTGR